MVSIEIGLAKETSIFNLEREAKLVTNYRRLHILFHETFKHRNSENDYVILLND